MIKVGDYVKHTWGALYCHGYVTDIFPIDDGSTDSWIVVDIDWDNTDKVRFDSLKCRASERWLSTVWSPAVSPERAAAMETLEYYHAITQDI